LTQDEFIEYLEALVAQVGSQAALARQLDISPQLLNDAIIGHRKPQPQLLEVLGFTRKMIYIPPETPRKFTMAK
jgi:hypothetical protein